MFRLMANGLYNLYYVENLPIYFLLILLFGAHLHVDDQDHTLTR